MIWFPTVNPGLREVIGSWKIIEMSFPRIWRKASALIERSSLSANCIFAAPTRLDRRGSNPMIDNAETVLPDPLSPTNASVSPFATSKLTSCTTFR